MTLRRLPRPATIAACEYSLSKTMPALPQACARTCSNVAMRWMCVMAWPVPGGRCARSALMPCCSIWGWPTVMAAICCGGCASARRRGGRLLRRVCPIPPPPCSSWPPPARVPRALRGRARGGGGAALGGAGGRASPTIRYGDIEMDPAARTVHQGGKLVEMSPREFSVLLVLLEARGRVLSRQQIEERLYSWDAAIESNAVEVHIHHLRRKLGSACIQTMRGVGYFMPQEAAA